jgi:hypothetical protein
MMTFNSPGLGGASSDEKAPFFGIDGFKRTAR